VVAAYHLLPQRGTAARVARERQGPRHTRWGSWLR